MNKLFLLLCLGTVLLGCEQTADNQAKTSDEAAQTQPSGVPGGEQTPAEKPLPTIRSASEPEQDSKFREITWDDLMPAEFQPAAILMKYQDQLAELEDDDPKAVELYGKIQAEMDNAPINDQLNGQFIRLPGFIAPLENKDGKVSEFLLVPYFGACIHVPPPPINQTVLVKTTADSALNADQVFDPVWVSGQLSTEGLSTDIGEAGYRIENAHVEMYDE